MPWKDLTIEELAQSLGANISEVREKQKLSSLIIKTRKTRGMSQAMLAKKLKISQGRVAQIESGIGTSRITFDVLLGALKSLGFEYRVVTKRAA